MNVYKVMIVVFCLLLTSLFLIDYFTASAQFATQQSDLEQALINAMYHSTHYGALREGKVILTPDFEEAIQNNLDMLGLKNVEINVTTVSDEPPLVTIEATKKKRNLLGWATGVEETSIDTRTVVIGDLIQEESDEE